MLPLPDRIQGRVAVVGTCGAGKSELVGRLRALGFDARHCAQEHSYVPDMWRRTSRAQVLIYLSASPPVLAQRRGRALESDWLEQQVERLAHARAHCDLLIDTDPLSPQDVASLVVATLASLGIIPPAQSGPAATENPPPHLT